MVMLVLLLMLLWLQGVVRIVQRLFCVYLFKRGKLTCAESRVQVGVIVIRPQLLRELTLFLVARLVAAFLNLEGSQVVFNARDTARVRIVLELIVVGEVEIVRIHSLVVELSRDRSETVCLVCVEVLLIVLLLIVLLEVKSSFALEGSIGIGGVESWLLILVLINAGQVSDRLSLFEGLRKVLEEFVRVGTVGQLTILVHPLVL